VADKVIGALNGTTMKGRSIRVDYDRGADRARGGSDGQRRGGRRPDGGGGGGRGEGGPRPGGRRPLVKRPRPSE
jgi:ATP-dependent RNA helicase DeaD